MLYKLFDIFYSFYKSYESWWNNHYYVTVVWESHAAVFWRTKHLPHDSRHIQKTSIFVFKFLLLSLLPPLCLQYRVESMMLRIAKPMNYIPVTPSVQQRSQMRAPQFVPLIMEPESRFYSNSVLVLDFQSLYPSIVIAYNYCFSTCLGHVENLGK